MGGDIENGTNPHPSAEHVDWHVLSVQDTVMRLKCDENVTQVGLTSAQAAERLAIYGPNKLSEKKKETIWQKIWKQVNNVLVFILVVIAVFSAVRAIVEHTMPAEDRNSTTILTSWIQVALILMVITINTTIGIMQEGSAEEAAEALKNMLSTEALVIRDGVEQHIPGQDVVPGDLVILGLGDRVPCDMRLVKVTNLATGEAALTGESVPIDKKVEVVPPKEGVSAELIPLGDRHNMCFSATLVAQGAGRGLAIATGDYTQIGTINKLVSEVEQKKTNVLEQIDQVSKLLAILIGLATLCTFLVAKLKSKQDWFESISTALVCCVAMVPEGLEAIVTLVYAWGVSNMAKQNAIIRALPAVETLGSVTVICSDKTGTLTQNIMSLTAFVTSNARYKFDVDNKDRVVTNFVRTDGYLAQRAQHLLDKSAHSAIKAAGAGGKKRGHISDSNHFTIDTSLHPVNLTEETNQDSAAAEPVSDSYPYANGSSPELAYIRNALSTGILCSHCKLGAHGGREGEIGNPTELAILRAAYFSGCDIDEIQCDSPIIAEVPFSSEYKFMATVHNPLPEDGLDGDSYVVHAKGAPDRMVKVCNTQAKAGVVNETEPIDTNFWIEQIAILSSHGLRVIALCRGSIPKSSIKEGDNLDAAFVNGKAPWLTLVGLTAIVDPPRPECVSAIATAKKAGIRVAMITGDHKDTAKAIGVELGLVDETYSEAITGPELDEMDDDEIQKAVMEHNVFARASPQNKIRIVKALQAQKQIASMTGDGVNDAPALKAADMGVAMGKEGTDVAREASDMILVDDNFATIVGAVREGRTVWDNLRKVLFINTPINNAQGMSVLFGLLFGLKFSPLSPIQVLYSNLICAITLGFVSAIEPPEDGIMDLPPRRIGKRLIGRYLLLRILLGTFTLTGLVVGSVFWMKSYNPGGMLPEDLDVYRDEFKVKGVLIPLKYDWLDVHAIAFNVLDFGAISITLSARFTYLSSFHPRVFFGNKYCWYSVFIVAALQVFTTHVPGLNKVVFQMRGMNGTQWGITLLFMVCVFVIMESEKTLRRYLKFKGQDTDDTEYGYFDNPAEGEAKDASLPKGASQLNLVSLEK